MIFDKTGYLLEWSMLHAATSYTSFYLHVGFDKNLHPNWMAFDNVRKKLEKTVVH